MPSLGSSNSAANKDVASHEFTNGDTSIWLSKKKHFSTMFSKAVFYLCVKMSIHGVKG